MVKALHTEYGKIEYTLQRRKMKNMRLRVENGRVMVSCAKSVHIKSIEEFILKHLQWIVETQKKLEQKKNGVLPVEYKSGEAFHFLGEEYALQIEPGGAKKAQLSDRTLLLKGAHDLEERKKLFLKWLTAQAQTIFEERLGSIYIQFARDIGPKPDLKLRKMKSRWGSANIKKRLITMNTALIFAPVQCIDYVAAHELAHFIHANHSKDFYAVLALHMPDWKARRVYLNKHYSLDL